MPKLHTIAEAYAEERRLAEEVHAWMREQAEQGSLRYNLQAPMWPDYQAAAEKRARADKLLIGVHAELAGVVWALELFTQDVDHNIDRMTLRHVAQIALDDLKRRLEELEKGS